MSGNTATSYDEVPYVSFPFPQSHPDRLATVATLFGLRPPNVEKCRILELGCASGGNLLPMAEALPGSTFVGIDLSARQIEDGKRAIGLLGLENVELKQMNITEVSPDLGHFDFIICHGIFSWVASAVQEKILEVCSKNLAPGGIAYISYNTLPGWRMRGMIRDMMMYHSSRFTTPTERVGQARGLLDFLVQSAAGDNSPYTNFLRAELESLGRQADWYVLHDHLEEHNDPVYFHQFLERAGKHGLGYLGESDVASMVVSNFPQQVQNTLDKLSADQVHLEQYMDFLRNRMFRQTLLCHTDQKPDYRVTAERLTSLHVASPAQPLSPTPDLVSGATEHFRCVGDMSIRAWEPIVKAALVVLGECWPRSLPFNKLRALARARLPGGPVQTSAMVAQDTAMLGGTLWLFYAASSLTLELSVRPIPAIGPVEKPKARAFARCQARFGNQVTNLRHETVNLNELQRELLASLDGTRDQAALLGLFHDLVAQGKVTVEQNGEPVGEPARVDELLREALTASLREFGLRSLLTQ